MTQELMPPEGEEGMSVDTKGCGHTRSNKKGVSLEHYYLKSVDDMANLVVVG